MKNASKIISEKVAQLSIYSNVLNSIELPKSLEVEGGLSITCLRLRGYCSYSKAAKMTDNLRKTLGGSSILKHYWLNENWTKKNEKIDTLFVSYSFGPLGSSERVEVDFEISNPNATLKALGLACRVKTVKKEASVRVTEARETRALVCPVSA